MSNSAKSTSFRAAAKGPKVKARLMYASPGAVEGLACGWIHVLPADEAAYEAMCEQMAAALLSFHENSIWKKTMTVTAQAQAALKSLGILRPKGTK